MIEGLKVCITGEELSKHLQKASAGHGMKAQRYLKQLADIHDPVGQGSPVSGDVLSGIEVKAKDHEEKEAYFRFLANHIIIPDEYLLSESDLRSIEIKTFY